MAAFVDEAQIHVKGGDGGAGVVSFRREPYVTKGGPDGGDGGRGGDVWLVADPNQATLLGFRDHPYRRGGDGKHGAGKNRHGARGADLQVPVPVGTTVRHLDGTVLADLAGSGDRWLAARGGRGGRGNARFLTNARRAPAFAEQAEPGEEAWYDLELKLVADVALVGFPNAGKSTLISRISAAKPKIADYPFTTLQPHLGVVRVGRPGDEIELVVADIPGLVEGAADGRGLGDRFLRHAERARVLVLLLDLASTEGHSPAWQRQVLDQELQRYRPELARRPRLVVGTKADAAADAATVDGLDLVLSSHTGQGVAELLGRLAGLVSDARAAAEEAAAVGVGAIEEAGGGVVIHRPLPEGVEVLRNDDGSWQVQGRAARRAVALSDLTDDDAVAYVQGRLQRLGVERALVRAGVRDGDTVHLGQLTFTYHRDEAAAEAAESGKRPPARPRGRRR